MKSFSDYYDSNKKEYKYTLKIASCDLDETQKEKIKSCLEKYNLSTDITYKKTPLQENPLDFPNIKHTEVHIADFTIAYPMTSDTLRKEIGEYSSINECCVVVYTENDPRKAVTADFVYRNSPEFKEDYVPAVGSEEQWEAEPKYGEEYNKEFLDTLNKKAKDRKVTVVTNTLIPPAKTDGSTVTGNETGKQNTTAVLNAANIPKKYTERKGPNTLFSKNGGN